MTTPTPPSNPRIGGYELFGNDYVFFSGGGCLKANRITEPQSSGAYRPDSDLRSKMRVEEACVRPLDEAKRIDEGASVVTFTQWTNDVKRHFADNGLDSVAYVLKPKKANSSLPDINNLTDVEQACNEYNLFEEWGVLSKEDMLAWEAALATSQTKMDSVNQRYARRFLRASVGIVLRERIDRELPIDVSGSRLLYFIIRKLQGVSSVSGRQLVDELQKIKLSAIPAYHVQECAKKIHDICTKLVGLGATHVPGDLSMLVCQCFDHTNIQAFDLEVTKLESDLDDDPTSHTWTSILDQLTTKFDKLRLSKRWPPLNADKPAVASGFAVQLEELKKGLRDVKSALHNTSKDKGDANGASQRDLSNVECNYCHKKGHYKSSCPSLANKSNGGTSDSPTKSTSDKKDRPKHWTRTGPSDTEPHTKSVTVEGKNVIFKWCGTCKRWRSGAKAHLTTEHKKKNAPATTIAGNTLQASSDGINFGLFTAETDFVFDQPIPGGFLETFYKFHPPPASDSDEVDDGSDWNLVREGDGTPFRKAKLHHPKDFAGQW
jgi:hypothetical protein